MHNIIIPLYIRMTKIKYNSPGCCGSVDWSSSLRPKGGWFSFKTEDSLRDIWNNVKRSNFCIIGVPERARDQVPI